MSELTKLVMEIANRRRGECATVNLEASQRTADSPSLQWRASVKCGSKTTTGGAFFQTQDDALKDLILVMTTGKQG